MPSSFHKTTSIMLVEDTRHPERQPILLKGGRRRRWHPTPVLLPGKSHGWRSLVGCSPWGCEESDTTERLHVSLSCIGEGDGTPLQYSCLENPREGGAWWAAVYGVAQSRTRLKRLSSSSSSRIKYKRQKERKKKLGMETHPGEGVVKKFPYSKKPSHRRVCGEFWNLRGQHNREEKKKKSHRIGA